MRNGILTATLIGGTALFLIDVSSPNAFLLVCPATGLWIIVRSIFGVIRIYTGIGTNPLRLAGISQ